MVEEDEGKGGGGSGGAEGEKEVRDGEELMLVAGKQEADSLVVLTEEWKSTQA